MGVEATPEKTVAADVWNLGRHNGTAVRRAVALTLNSTAIRLRRVLVIAVIMHARSVYIRYPYGSAPFPLPFRSNRPGRVVVCTRPISPQFRLCELLCVCVFARSATVSRSISQHWPSGGAGDVIRHRLGLAQTDTHTHTHRHITRILSFIFCNHKPPSCCG